jgi:predicted translin family RNA/ssDNA-binding protein
MNHTKLLDAQIAQLESELAELKALKEKYLQNPLEELAETITLVRFQKKTTSMDIINHVINFIKTHQQCTGAKMDTELFCSQKNVCDTMA